jgi:phage nucleotide-binding protein
MKIRSTKDSKATTVKALVYGPAGIGKTTLAGTLKSRTLIISAESGLLSLQNKEIDVIDLSLDDNDKPLPKSERIAKLRKIYQWLTTDEVMKKYKAVFIDSLTEINMNMLEYLQTQFPDRKDSLVMYGELSKNMRALITLFRDLPHYDVIFTALAETEKDENGFRFQTVQLVGSFASRITGYFDEVFYMTHSLDGERVLLTQKTDRIIAKDRSGKLSTEEKPDLGIVLEKILSEPKKPETTNETKGVK